MVRQRQISICEGLQNLAKRFEFYLEVIKDGVSLNFGLKLKVSLKEIEGKIETANI